jgi:hypothetical protein
MQSNKTNGVEKILTSFDSLNTLPKIIIKFGTQTFLALFALGSFLVAYNHLILNCNPNYEFIATSLVHSSFTIFAEVIIGALVIDFIFKKT